MSTSNTAPRTSLRLLIGIVAIVLLAPLLLMGFMMPMMGMMGMMGWAGGGPGSAAGLSPMWGLPTVLLFVIVLLGIGYGGYRVFTRGAPGVDDPAMTDVRLAYARGEISEEEFEQRRENLRRSE